MMSRTKVTTVMAVAAFGAFLSAPARAQETRLEISGNAGWTFSDGVSSSGGAINVPGVGTFNRIDPKDSFSWGLTAGYHFTENWELEFQYDQQQSKLEAGGTNTVEIGDFKIHTYHGVFAYNFGDERASARPFVFFGAGATSYPGLTFTSVITGQPRTIDGKSQFSGTFGLGVKVYPSKNAGIRLQGRWTPTYIKSDQAGWWCDPYWGCYVVSNAQYSNQFELTGGITLRF
jgi:outer membrane protein W